MPQGASNREFARILTERGMKVGESAVRKAKAAGKLVLFADDSIDVEPSIERWAQKSDPARTKVRTVRTEVRTHQESARPAVTTEAEAREAVSLIARVLQEERGGDAPRTIDFDAVRTAETILKARERELNIEAKRKRLIPADKVATYVGRCFVEFRQSMQRIPARFGAQMAAEIGCETHLLDAVLTRTIASVLDELAAPTVRT